MVIHTARQADGDDEDGEEDGSKPPRIEIRLTVPSNERSDVLINHELQAQLETAGAIFNRNAPLPFVPSAQVRIDFPFRFYAFYLQPHSFRRCTKKKFWKQSCRFDTVIRTIRFAKHRSRSLVSGAYRSVTVCTKRAVWNF
jgi:hypothetical protein